MKTNMGIVDRVIRAAIAVVVVGLYLTGIIEGTGAIVALILAGIFFLTSFIGFCPIYAPFRFSTKDKSKHIKKV